jgi:hypoxanthine phosphoribosyltransferase
MVLGRPLFSVEEIQKKVKELAGEISKEYAGKEVVAVAILKGAFMFFSDLVRYIKIPITVDFITCSSYVKNKTTGKVKIESDLKSDIRGKHVLLVEDIADTGVTLNFLREHLLQREPASLKICALLDKKERRIAQVPIDFKGFTIPNEFVVGYGLDYENKFRNLPYIAVFKKSV